MAKLDLTRNNDRLKSGYWDIHESLPSEDQLLKDGTITKEQFIDRLGQQSIARRALDDLFVEKRAHSSMLATLATDERLHSQHHLHDLRYFGVDPDGIETWPETQRQIDFLTIAAERDPDVLVGIHFLFEGATNGGMLIGNAAKKAFELPGQDGITHLQPYGKAMMARFREYLDEVNALTIPDLLMEDMKAVARETFNHVNALTFKVFHYGYAAEKRS